MDKLLIKFNCKRRLRLFLRNNNLMSVRRSSIYQIGKDYYILINGEESAAKISQVDIQFLEIYSLTQYQNFLFDWAIAEILQNISFIRLEQDSVLEGNARVITLDGIKIKRTFEGLVDVLAILNYTQDSFSDGGKHNSIDKALELIEIHLQNKAKIIDLGVESTNPDAKPLAAEEEIAKLQEIIPYILNIKKSVKFKLSVDTYHSETVKWLLDQDVEIINDVSGRLPLELVRQITLNNKLYIAMHSLSVPAQKEMVLSGSTDPVNYLYEWMNNTIIRLSDYKINIENVILDPGIGFGLTPVQCWYVIKNLDKFNDLPCEILLGHSRKSFLGYTNTKKAADRDFVTALVSILSAENIDYLRLHDLNLYNELLPVYNQLN